MLWYIFLVAVVNLSLGFAVAVYARRRYQQLCVLAVEAALPELDSLPELGPGSPVPGAPGADSADAPSEQEVPGRSEADAASEQEVLGQREVAVDEPGEAGEAGEHDSADEEGQPVEETAASADECREEPAPAEPEGEAASAEQPPLSPRAASVAQFQGEVEQYRGELVRLDNAFRTCGEAPEPDEVQSHVDSLREVSEEFVESRDQARETFQAAHADEEGLEDVEEGVRAGVDQQDAEIEQTRRAIDELDYEDDLAEGCRQIVQQTNKLIDANDGLRDALQEASVAAARDEGRLEAIERPEQKDEVTELSTRGRLEACLADWWEKDPHRARQLIAAMIDVDEFARLNEQYGRDVGDRVLRAIGQLLAAESRNHLLIARFAGQRFLLLFPDVDTRFTTGVVERIRQTIEMAKLDYRGEAVRVTVSCAVTEVVPDDTPQSLYARADATLREAKRYGRNRTFLHEDKYPTPVVPPNFTLKEKRIPI